MVLHVREISNEEGNKLRRIVRKGREPIEVKRAQVILASAQGFHVDRISLIAIMSEQYVRQIINAFNEHGFDSLKPKWGPGAPRTFTDEHREKLVAMATSRPKDLGLPFQEWSLSRLRKAAMDQGIVESISEEWLRVILHESQISSQSIRTWKVSNDPEFVEKKRRIEWLTRQQHNPPYVFSADEIGPIQLIPHGGKGWFDAQRPGRIPAEYNKENGTFYYALAVNVFRQTLSGEVLPSKHGPNWLAYMRRTLWHVPRDRPIYWIQDGLSSHWTPEIRAWAEDNNVELVATATHASWMNPVECHAGDIQDLALSGTNFSSREEGGMAMDNAVRYRNEERKDRGKLFRDRARDKRRRPKRPIWKRPS